MFTGLIGDVGELVAIERHARGARLVIASRLAAELGHGDSIAVAGACLTAIDVAAGDVTASDDQAPPGRTSAPRFAAEAMNETLARTTLGSLRDAARVNLELPLRAGDRLGGHIVQGHVDGTGAIAQVREDGFSRVLEIEADPALLRYLVEKGSVAIDGVSLTVASLDDKRFAVALIPETIASTTLGSLAPGQPVNLEVDILAKHVERLLGERARSSASEP